jgi:hypothetical protein
MLPAGAGAGPTRWQGAAASSGSREICFPQLPLVNPVEIFIKYVERNPSRLNQHVGHVAYAAFLEAYPCKK